jgi:hypothetical protein
LIDCQRQWSADKTLTISIAILPSLQFDRGTLRI